jgi:hypothetical protein
MVISNLKVFTAVSIVALMSMSAFSLTASLKPGPFIPAQRGSGSAISDDSVFGGVALKGCLVLAGLGAFVAGSEKLFTYAMVPENIQSMSAVQLVEAMNEKTLTTFKWGGCFGILGSAIVAYRLMQQGFSENKNETIFWKHIKAGAGIGIGIGSLVGAIKLFRYKLHKV